MVFWLNVVAESWLQMWKCIVSAGPACSTIFDFSLGRTLPGHFFRPDANQFVKLLLQPTIRQCGVVAYTRRGHCPYTRERTGNQCSCISNGVKCSWWSRSKLRWIARSSIGPPQLFLRQLVQSNQLEVYHNVILASITRISVDCVVRVVISWPTRRQIWRSRRTWKWQTDVTLVSQVLLVDSLESRER